MIRLGERLLDFVHNQRFSCCRDNRQDHKRLAHNTIGKAKRNPLRNHFR